jgi:hypothetical protein
MEYKSLFACLLLTSINFGASVVIFTRTLSQTRFKLSALSPETSLGFKEDLVTTPKKPKEN